MHVFFTYNKLIMTQIKSSYASTTVHIIRSYFYGKMIVNYVKY